MITIHDLIVFNNNGSVSTLFNHFYNEAKNFADLYSTLNMVLVLSFQIAPFQELMLFY